VIVANQEILDEVEAFGFKLALVQSTMWSPTRTELKYKLIATNLNDELVAEWEFPSESKAEVAFREYCALASV
jgi:hypothetical protein